MNGECACAEYFCCARNSFTDIADADDLVHAQEFKDMVVLMLRFSFSLFIFASLCFVFCILNA